MSFAQHIREAAQHDDWRGYVCPITNKVLTAFLALEDRQFEGGATNARTFMLIVAEALDGGAPSSPMQAEGGKT